MSGLSNVIFNRQQGIGRQPTGQDHISGLLFYSNSLPAGFASDDRVKRIFTVADAENLGVVDTHADETVATGGEVTITVAGTAGDVERFQQSKVICCLS